MTNVIQNVYPKDLTMSLASNHIEREKKLFTGAEDRIFVPDGGPFYSQSLIIKDNNGAILKPQVDYQLLYLNEGATIESGRDVVTVINVLKSTLPYVMLDYRVVGGEFGNTVNAIMQEITKAGPIQKNVDWNVNVYGKPVQFPPAPHYHTPDTFTGWKMVYTQLEGMRKAIIVGDDPSWESHYNYLNRVVNNVEENINGALNNYATKTYVASAIGSIDLKVDLSGYYLKSEVDSRLTTLDGKINTATNSLGTDYYTKTAADGKYALKTASYTKSESDGRYASKSDLGSYSTTLVADGKYATKLSLNDYYTQVDADSRYALKTQSYTKSESDGRYLGNTALNEYLTQSAADGRYQSKVDMSQYLSKSSHDYSVIKNIEVERGPMLDKYSTIRIVEQKSGFLTEQTAKIDLSNYMLVNEAPGIELYNITIDSIRQGMHILYIRSFTSNVPYRNYSLPIKWKIVRNGGMAHITWECTTPFHWGEDMMNLYTPDSNLSSLNTTLPTNNVSSNKLYPTIANWFNSPIINAGNGDYWQRLGGRVSIDKNTGHLHIPMFSSTATGKVTFYCTSFYGGVSLVVDSDEIDTAISLWAGNSSSATRYTPIAFR